VPDAEVDGLLGEPRVGQLHAGAGERDDDRERHLAAVGAQVGQQPHREPVVVGAAAALVELARAHEAAISSSICWARWSAA
jgi:hypothetical protein